VGNKAPLFGLYAALGQRLKAEFGGWRVGLVTSEPKLAHACALPFGPPGPFVDHGGIRIRLWQTPPP
jgi:putative N6-adenine-specific DNA methylase